jgi:hypothetical protein
MLYDLSLSIICVLLLRFAMRRSGFMAASISHVDVEKAKDPAKSTAKISIKQFS